ncbi:MAG: PH domain-containing protein [Chloroflexi bacterium]|nr:PH domain-containing protein [Chloroflexota bacterium]
MSYLQKLLGKNETITFSTRRHWTAFVGGSWVSILLFLVAVVLAVLVNLYTSSIDFGLQASQQILLREGIVVALLAYPVISILIHYFRWSSEQYVVTNLRVIHLSGVLSKHVIDSSLEKVNDVMLRQSLIGRILGFGDLDILTASETAGNQFHHLAQPLAFKGAMLEAKQELERGDQRETDQIPGLISKLAALRDQGTISEQEFEVGKTRLLRDL